MHYREATGPDHQTIVQFQMEMAFETEGYNLDLPTVQKGVQAVFDDPSKGKYFVAESADQKVCASLLIVKEWSDWRNGEVWWIHSVYVVPELRGAKVFSGLYNHVKKTVEADPNLRGLRLYVEKKNLKAQKVYEKLGMTSDHYHLYEWMKTF